MFFGNLPISIKLFHRIERSYAEKWSLLIISSEINHEVLLSKLLCRVVLLMCDYLTIQIFQKYKQGRRHQYYGGLIKRSPVRLVIPHSGHWHVTVDLQGLGGKVRSSIQILPDPLPPLPEYSPAPLSRLVHDTTSTDDNTEYLYDVFISHATEDKDDIVRPLAEALINQNLRVWYDEFELRLGDSLRRKIDVGLTQSRFGIVVLSHAFF